ncbi:MAG: hypothetical protein WA063_02960 [Minisyncoccia bacterium]
MKYQKSKQENKFMQLMPASVSKYRNGKPTESPACGMPFGQLLPMPGKSFSCTIKLDG